MERKLKIIAILCTLFCYKAGSSSDIYIIDDSNGFGRTFYGIGAISGGGVSVICGSTGR